MDKKVKKVWVKALRSGKYKKGTGMLKSSSGYCCLGVLTDIYLKQKRQTWLKNKLEVETADADLNPVVCEWAGISGVNRRDPKVRVGHGWLTLSTINDSTHKPRTFKEIAAIIDKHL